VPKFASKTQYIRVTKLASLHRYVPVFIWLNSPQNIRGSKLGNAGILADHQTDTLTIYLAKCEIKAQNMRGMKLTSPLALLQVFVSLQLQSPTSYPSTLY
jgi:hypothetical protein